MISFIIALLALVAGYFFYGKLVEKVFGPDDRPTPAVSKADGVDYIVLPGWKVFMIQFLNIAGTVCAACSPCVMAEQDCPSWWVPIWVSPRSA